MAMRAVPAEFETMIEFGEKYVEPVPPFAIKFVNIERQLPAIEKQPLARLIPPVDENVDVAEPKLIPFVVPMERRDDGDVVPMPR